RVTFSFAACHLTILLRSFAGRALTGAALFGLKRTRLATDRSYSPGLGHTVYRRRRSVANAELLPTPKQPTSWLTLLPPRLRRLLSPVWQSVGGSVEEIRIVQGQPIIVRTATGEWFVAPWGVADDLAAAVTADESMIHELLDAATRSSVYAVQDAIDRKSTRLNSSHVKISY